MIKLFFKRVARSSIDSCSTNIDTAKGLVDTLGELNTMEEDLTPEEDLELERTLESLNELISGVELSTDTELKDLLLEGTKNVQDIMKKTRNFSCKFNGILFLKSLKRTPACYLNSTMRSLSTLSTDQEYREDPDVINLIPDALYCIQTDDKIYRKRETSYFALEFLTNMCTVPFSLNVFDGDFDGVMPLEITRNIVNSIVQFINNSKFDELRSHAFDCLTKILNANEEIRLSNDEITDLGITISKYKDHRNIDSTKINYHYDAAIISKMVDLRSGEMAWLAQISKKDTSKFMSIDYIENARMVIQYSQQKEPLCNSAMTFLCNMSATISSLNLREENAMTDSFKKCIESSMKIVHCHFPHTSEMYQKIKSYIIKSPVLNPNGFSKIEMEFETTPPPYAIGALHFLRNMKNYIEHPIDEATFIKKQRRPKTRKPLRQVELKTPLTLTGSGAGAGPKPGPSPKKRKTSPKQAL